MILRGDTKSVGANPDGKGATLDDLFRRAGVNAPAGLALADPGNRDAFTDGAPRQLTYAEADRAISALAAKLLHLGLQADTVVAVQLPNTVENIVTLLAVLRAGMIAAPLPLLWRRRELTAALSHIGAKVIITTTRAGSIAQADIAMQVASEVFPIRFICAFGHDLPDGVVGLDDIFAAQQPIVVPRAARSGYAADHVAVVTFDTTAQGVIAVARSHGQLIAGGAAVIAAAGASRTGHILTAIPPSSFAGMATGLMPWLLEGGTLALHHGFDPATFAAQSTAQDSGMIVLPGPAVASLAAARHIGDGATVVALWRSPEQLSGAATWRGNAALVDVASFGEVGLVTTTRGADGLPADMPHGRVDAEDAGSVETFRDRRGTLALRGAMVPTLPFPPGVEHSGAACLAADKAGFVDTGFTCKLADDNRTLTVSGPPGGLATIGGYRFRTADLEAQVQAADPAAIVVALPAVLLAQRLAGSALYIDTVKSRLCDNGANPLLVGAFRPRTQPGAETDAA